MAPVAKTPPDARAADQALGDETPVDDDRPRLRRQCRLSRTEASPGHQAHAEQIEVARIYLAGANLIRQPGPVATSDATGPA